MTSKRSCSPCYLCGRDSKTDEAISFFGFPRHETAKASWAEFCGMKVSNVTPNLRLCSRHFTEDDFSNNDVSIRRRLNLKYNAVPSLREPVCDENRVPVRNSKRMRKCLLCKSSTTNTDLSFFRFPRDEDTLPIWAAFCGITTDDIRSSTYLCSSHFSEDSFIKTSIRMTATRKLLKKKAIPTIVTTNGSQSDLSLGRNGVRKEFFSHNARCVLCGPVREENRSFFSFPKDENIRKQWEQFCSRKRTCFKFIIPRLCEKHFTRSDLLFDYVKDGGYVRLKEDTVPTLFMDGFDPNKSGVQTIHQLASDSYSMNVDPNILTSVDPLRVDEDLHPNPLDVVSTVIAPSNAEEVICGDENDVILNKKDSPPPTVFVSIIESPEMESVSCAENDTDEKATIPQYFLEKPSCDQKQAIHDQCYSSEDETIPASPRKPHTFRNGLFMRRYVGDWKRTDMKCPELAVKFFDCAQKSIAKKNQFLKLLRTRNDRLTKHIHSLLKLTDQKEESIIS